MRRFVHNIWLLALIMSLLAACGKPSKNTEQDENPVENFSGLVSINGTELYCKIIGSGEPVVILHGGPGLDHTYLLPHFLALADKYQLIFYDQRGGGQSSINVDTASISMENFIEDLEGIRKHFEVGKISLMAHSFGGLIAMNYAIKYPENLNSLILIGSVAPTSEMMQSASLLDAANVSPEDSIEFNEILTSEEMANGDAAAIEKLMRLSFKRQFFNKNFADSLNLSITERFITTSGLLSGLQKDLIDFDLTDELAQVTVPTLIIYGDYETTYKVSDEILYKTMPNGQNWVLRDCGHFPFIEKKNDFERIVNNFMAGLKE